MFPATTETNEVVDNENVTIEEMLPAIEEDKEDNSPVSEEDKHLIVKSGEELNVPKTDEEIELEEKHRKVRGKLDILRNLKHIYSSFVFESK